MFRSIKFIFLFCIIGINTLSGQNSSTVRLYEEKLNLPTYVTHAPDPNPMFFTNQSYQGASRVVYPYPLMDNLSNKREFKNYKALYLENEYIKLCILPEIGGRLFYATDLTNNYEIFYRQNVIKPANIGMLGAWISGGIEWCVFHHHRASTFLPVDYTLVENKNGSATIWFGEIEPRHRMRWIIGITLYPGKSYIEASVKMFNRTAIPNSILYWANVATHVNEDYQVIFPSNVKYATYHAKNSFAHWPITNEVYNNNDYYKNNVDASWWKNHPNPISFFTHNLKENFMAGYDYSRDAGTVHVGDYHIVTGAKLWEWGPGEYGTMWDTQVLTDSDGPYAELMVGAYSDNQPDYSWIKPYETKHFNQYWYPLRETDGLTNANLNAAVNLKQLSNNKILLAFNTTQFYKNAKVKLFAGNLLLHEKIIDIDPSNLFRQEIEISEAIKFVNLKAELLTEDGEELVSYQPKDVKYDSELPDVVNSPLPPEQIKTIEELYLTGLRIKQFHNARLNPLDYFEEALNRDPFDSRCNIQVGLDLMQKGLEYKAANKFRNAIKRIAENYTSPQNCEAFYYLGLILKSQGKYHAAYDTLFKATWDQGLYSAAYYQVAEISSIQENYVQALDHINRSLETNVNNTKGKCFKTAILRKLNKYDKAEIFVKEILDFDPLDCWAHNELYLVQKISQKPKEAEINLQKLKTLLQDRPESYLELASDYMNAGFYSEAKNILERAIRLNKKGLSDYAAIFYYVGYLHSITGFEKKAKEYFDLASKKSIDYVFPFRLESINVYKTALKYYSSDSRAHYYLGNLLYDRQPEAAITHWEKAVFFDPSLAIAYRNLGWGYNHQNNDLKKSIKHYELAIKQNNTDPKYFYELDVLYEKNATPIKKRLDLLESHHEYVKKRNDALLREILVLITAGKYDKAIEYMNGHYFHRQEGTSTLHNLHVDAHLLRGLVKLNNGQYEAALADFWGAYEYPDNHQIGRNPDYVRNPQIYYLFGLAHKMLNDQLESEKYLAKAVSQNIGQSWYVFYQGLSFQMLNESKKAQDIFDELLDRGKEQLHETVKIDFFAKFGEEVTKRKIEASAHFIIGLGYFGKKLNSQAQQEFEKAVELNGNHIWANHYLELDN